MSKLSVVLCILMLGACVGDAGGTEGDDGPGSGSGGGGGSGGGSGSGMPPAGPVFGAYKDTSINMDWNTNVISTMVPGTRTALVDDMVANHASTITLAFATGECGSENFGGVPGAAMASANASSFAAKNINYIVATGGAAGSFTCASDAGFLTFL